MRLDEDEAKRLAATVGLPVPLGEVATTPEEAAGAATRIGPPVVVKALVLAGGRGRAGLVARAEDAEEAEREAARILAAEHGGKPIQRLRVEKAVEVARERYLAVTTDEIAKRSVVLFAESGGVDVEEIAGRAGARIARRTLDPFVGLPPFVAREVAREAGLIGREAAALGAVAHALHALHQRYDCTLSEANPLVWTKGDGFVAADLRVEIDDDSLARQRAPLASLGIPVREDRSREPTPIEREAARIDAIDHRGVAGRLVEFDGDIALLIGGGGASLTIFDAVLRHGGRPANYCEIGGNPTVRKVEELTRLIASRPGIRCLAVITNVLSNTRADLVARGVLKGLTRAGIDLARFPVVFRVPGAWEDESFRILEKYGIRHLTRESTLDEAAAEIVRLGASLGP